MIRTIVMMALTLVLLPADARAQLNEAWGVPGSPTGMAVARVLEMIDRGDDDFTRKTLQEHFAPDFVEAFPMSRHLSFFRQLHEDFPGLEPEGLRRTPDGASFGLRSASAGTQATVSIAVDGQGRIVSMGVTPGAAQPADIDDDRPLADFLDRLEDEDRFSGVVVDVRDGRTLFAAAYGLADKRTGTPNTLDTRFNVGSINKAFTAAAILLLEREGLVDLDATLGTYLGGFPDDVAGSVTVRHLLRHRSGWGHYWENETFRSRLTEMREVDDYLAFIRELTPDFEPGTSRRYSNVGYEVLGAIVEAVSGMSYYRFVEERILRPLGMDDTGFFIRDRPTPRIAIGYTDQHPHAVGEGYAMENTFLLAPRGTPAGGAYSTAEDLIRFFTGLLEGDVLDRDAYALMLNDFDPEADFPGGPDVLGGGGPGIRATILLEPARDHFAVVLSNYDTQSISSIVQRLETTR